MDERTTRIKEAFSDEAFVKAMLEADNTEAVQQMLAGRGVEMSIGEIEMMGELLEAGAHDALNMEAVERLANGGELTEQELEQAAGGGFLDIFFKMEWKELLNGREAADGFEEMVLERALADTNGPVHTALYGVATREQVRVGVNWGTTGCAIAVGVIAVAGIGYGVYDAVRRRW